MTESKWELHTQVQEFFQKKNEKIRLKYYCTSSRIVFVHFGIATEDVFDCESVFPGSGVQEIKYLAVRNKYKPLYSRWHKRYPN